MFCLRGVYKNVTRLPFEKFRKLKSNEIQLSCEPHVICADGIGSMIKQLN